MHVALFLMCSSQGSGSAASAARLSPFSPRTWTGWIPVTSTGMREAGHGRCRNLVWGLRAISFRTAYEKYSEGPGPSLPSSLCSSQGSSSAASAARVSLFSPMTWSGWIPVTGTGMREAGMHGLCNFRLRIREGMFNLIRNERLRLHSRIEAKRNTVYGRDP
jgi:hypothetical protein